MTAKGETSAQTEAAGKYVALADLCQLNLEGQQVAAEVLETLQSHCADPDAIFHTLKVFIPDSRDIAALTYLRGFCRQIQKRLERGELCR